MAVLRSKKEHVKPDKEQDGIFFASYSRLLDEHSQFLDNRSEFLDKKDRILKDTDTSHKSKKILLAVAVMKTVLGEKEENFNYKITRNDGIIDDIIFDFGNGTKIIDNGQKISYTDKAKNLAIDYATVKFGMRELSLEGKELITKNEISYDDIKQTQKIGAILLDEGEVSVMYITDRQYGLTENFFGKKQVKNEQKKHEECGQLFLF